ncbi:MAG: ECF transporter S component [Desulfomicrobium sp.]|nr:ECF transporter S component [Pseudomonadota bacterium]MBV1713439.1 ECF transporter S component [Desulfomicrobium sp.]MBU4570427.1 ECF transporter S component [Pseudomonadota bacterium]MBU4593784.1 ECF transporter S component [Pseudomonadota bacterium]MBV1719762.1 ECF transporter S component [Desulfomicrobium sp.]
MKNIKIAALSIVALTCLTTLFIRIPLPSRGYFNVGDVAVVFGGLVLGFMNPKQGVIWALAACGIGSALADILGGFAVFAPLTLLAKGAEGALAAVAASRTGAARYLMLGLGGLAMVSTYFIGEVMMPNIGLQGAVAEIPANVVQAVGGAVGGVFAATALKKTKLI